MFSEFWSTKGCLSPSVQRNSIYCKSEKTSSIQAVSLSFHFSMDPACLTSPTFMDSPRWTLGSKRCQQIISDWIYLSIYLLVILNFFEWLYYHFPSLMDWLLYQFRFFERIHSSTVQKDLGVFIVRWKDFGRSPQWSESQKGWMIEICGFWSWRSHLLFLLFDTHQLLVVYIYSFLSWF